MTEEKFNKNVLILKEFFELYCKNKHDHLLKKTITLIYKKEKIIFDIALCEECHLLIKKAFFNLQNCTQEEKPRCRKCPNPCYDKQTWKKIAKIMRYSSIRISLKKLKNNFTK